MANTTHDGHVEPSLASHAVSVWACAIPATWLFVANFGYLRDSLIALAVFVPVCLWICSGLSCRNASNMSGFDMFKSLGLIAVPWLILVFYIYAESKDFNL